MDSDIKVIIADDNIEMCNFIKTELEKYKEIILLGIANTDEQEIDMIEQLRPDIVITDLMRNHRYTGLDIIRKYSNKEEGPEFLVISSDNKEDIVKEENLKISGYLQKPFFKYEEIIEELRKIKEKMIEKQNMLPIVQTKESMRIRFIRKIIEFFKNKEI